MSTALNFFACETVKLLVPDDIKVQLANPESNPFRLFAKLLQQHLIARIISLRGSHGYRVDLHVIALDRGLEEALKIDKTKLSVKQQKALEERLAAIGRQRDNALNSSL